MTQTDAVLAALRRNGPDGLTPLDALADIGTFRLAARIADAKALIAEDEEIVNEWATFNGKTVARYVLRKKAPTGVHQDALPW